MKRIPLFILFAVLGACHEGNKVDVNTESNHDTTNTVSIPTFDISGEFEALFVHAHNEISAENGMKVLTVQGLADNDSLFFQYKTANQCEECHVEFQIWKNDKYVDVVRDTGFGGEKMYIPASRFLGNSKFGTPEYERLSIYLSVRQFHPVETGNKRFLFYLDMK